MTVETESFSTIEDYITSMLCEAVDSLNDARRANQNPGAYTSDVKACLNRAKQITMACERMHNLPSGRQAYLVRKLHYAATQEDITGWWIYYSLDPTAP